MPETKTDAPVKFGGAYKESDDHKPNPTDMYGQMNTSGTGSHQVIEDVTPVFEIAKKQAHIQAARAIDPNDHDVPASRVVFPEATRLVEDDREAHESAIKSRARTASRTTVVGGKGPSARAAAEEGDAAKAKAEAATAAQGTTSPTSVAGKQG